MPTIEMSSDDAIDGVDTTAVGDALNTAVGDAVPGSRSAQNPVNSVTADKCVVVDAVFDAHPCCSSRVRNPPPKYSERAASLKKCQTSKKSIGKDSTATK